jgi:serine/threonine-protein kinase
VNPGEARQLARQLAAGLAEAHRNHVVHGDLKSNNIILAKSAGGGIRAVITDFGLACQPDAVHRLTSSLVGGALAYMAPEMLKGATPSTASDVFALGVLFHELVTGARPGAPPNGSRPALVDRKWVPVLSRCLHPDPAQRFPNAEAVLTALEPQYTRRWVVVASSMPLAAALCGVLWFTRAPGNSIPSIAVLPFTNDTGEATLNYLCDGLSESLIHALSQLPGIKVIARSSSWKYTQPPFDARKVASALGVQALVTGRLYRAAGALQISAELIDGLHATQKWGQVYSPGEVSLAAVQGRLSGEIALQIRSRITPQERQRVERWASAKPEAYELLLRGRYQTRLYTTPNRLKAISYYEQAVAVDPAFALAHAELAYTIRMASGGGIMDPAEALPRAEAEARRAMAIAPDLPEAYEVLADVNKDRWQWSDAERDYRKALELSPSLAEAHVGYAIFLSQMGRAAEAIAAIRRAEELDPVGLTTRLHMVAVFYNSDLYDQALEAVSRAAELDPATPVTSSWRAVIHSAAGRFTEAIPAFETALRMGDHTSSLQCFYAYALARSGRIAEARNILDELLRSRDFVPLTGLAAVYLGLRENELALQTLERAYEARDSMLQYLTVEAHFDELRHEPRYREVARKIGLPL